MPRRSLVALSAAIALAVSAFSTVVTAAPVAAAAGRSLRAVPVMTTGQSPPLRLLHASPNARGLFPGAAEDQPIRHGRVVSGPTDTATLQTQAGNAAAVSAGNTFEGQGNADGVVPPDTNGDIGPNNYVQWVNLHLNVYSRTGALQMSVPGNQIFAGLGASNPCSYDNDGDPIVQYDQFHDRWVLTQFAFDDFLGVPLPPFGQCVAVSKTSDPTGAYWLYSWDTGAAGNTGTDYFPDYPKLGIWPDGYYMSFNYFTSDLSTFVGSGIMIMESAKMLTGDPTARALATGPMGGKYGGRLAPDLGGTAVPPPGTPATYAAFDSDQTTNTLQFWHAHVDWTTGSATFGTSGWAPNATLTVPAYDWNFCPAAANFSCIPQPGTSQQLATLSDRLMYRADYRYFPSDGHEAMVLTQTVDADPTSAVRAGVRWYEVRSVSSTPTLFQSGTYSPTADDRWMPSIAMNKAGDIAIGYSVSSSSVYPSIRWTGRTAADPAGVMSVAESSITAGSGSQTGYDRWGDYSALTVDPVDDCTFWYTNEYYPSSSSYGWHTRIGWFRISDCGTTTPPASPPPTPTGVTATGQGGSSAGTIAVSWSPATGATSYEVDRLSGSTWSPVTTTSSTSYVDSSLQAVTQYSYRVIASNSAGPSAPSSVAAAYTSPTQLIAKTVSGSEIDLTWNGSSAATGYRVYRSSGGSAYVAIASPTTASYKNTGLSRSTSYSYYVTATVSGATTAGSNTATAKTLRR